MGASGPVGRLPEQEPVDNAYMDEEESEYALPPTWADVLPAMPIGFWDDVE